MLGSSILRNLTINGLDFKNFSGPLFGILARIASIGIPPQAARFAANTANA
jgi:hypothetical protein